MKPGYGIIGCGNISRFHFGGLKKIHADIVYIADINEKAAAPYVREFGAKFTRDYNELIGDPGVSVVSVLTGSKLHKDICLKALAAGKHIICEKTMMENAGDAQEVAELAKSSGSLFFTAFMKRFFPAVVRAKELMPALGTLFSAQIRSYQPWGNFFDAKDEGAFKFVLDSYGGAVTRCAGSHMLDLMLHLLGRPEGVFAHMDYLPGTKFDRKVSALFKYGGSLTAFFEAAAHPLQRIGYERNSWDESVQINGVNGRLEIYTVMWDHPENNGALLVHYDNEKGTSTEYRFAPVNPFDLELEYFNACLAAGKQGKPDAIDGFNVDLVIEMMEKSNQGKLPVEFDWRGL